MRDQTDPMPIYTKNIERTSSPGRARLTLGSLRMVICALVVMRSGGLGAGNDDLQILSDDHPKAFFFRAAEAQAADPRIDYEVWASRFCRLMGITGKVLEEEVPGRSIYNPEFFRRFKAAHPEQLVLLHYNGNARDPRFERGPFFAGHWLHYLGATILDNVPAQDGITEIAVSTTDVFRMNTGRYLDKNDDIALCALDDQGRPDWFRCEQVVLESLDAGRGIIRVVRGQYGTQPQAFAAGRAYAAAHVAEGPWGQHSNLMWFYNYATESPRDAGGQQAWEVHAADVARRFQPGGELETFDGIEFDVLFLEHGSGGREKDMDGDGRPDSGRFDDVSPYALGVWEFTRRIRQQLPGKLILADGHHPRHQRSAGILNGIESEGWPDAHDTGLEGWSSGLNRHAYWDAFGHRPAFHYINHKFVAPGDAPGQVVIQEVPFSTHRLVMAAAMFTNAAFCYSYQPPREPGEGIGIWDELAMGTARRVGWLGKPIAPPHRLAKRAPPLMGGTGSGIDGRFLARFAGEDVSHTFQDGTLTLEGAPGTEAITFTLGQVPAQGPDLFIMLKSSAAGLPGYPADMPRLAQLTLPASVGWFITADLPEAGIRRRGGPEQALDPESGARLSWQPDLVLADRAHDAYFVHPPYLAGATGYTFWMRDATVPAEGTLDFYLGMGVRAPGRSDGVTFQVHIAELVEGNPGAFSPVFEHQQVASAWTAHTVRLDHLAGRRVRFKFISDAGPHDSPTTDHSYWGEVTVTGPGGVDELTPAQTQMTWMGPQAFESHFYFKSIQASSVDLKFSIEGATQVVLIDFAAYPHPDGMARIFEGGLVLANPSPAPFTFDLRQLSSGGSYSRLLASPSQDRIVNNGTPVGEQVTLPPMDALFLSITTPLFSRGDCNGDGNHDISDVICLLMTLFADMPMTCEEAMDVNDDGRFNLADPISLLSHLFLETFTPPAPFPGCGSVRGTGSLGCEYFPGCQ